MLLQYKRYTLVLLGLLVLPLVSFAQAPVTLPAGLHTETFFSPAVNRLMKYDIVLPEDYERSDKRYPVLYLLHGYMQNYTVWGRNLGAAFYARDIGELIVVMPDAGNSWYINYAESANEQSNNWEDHIIEDVIGHVDANFAPRRAAKAGLSAGCPWEATERSCSVCAIRTCLYRLPVPAAH